jgi:chromate transporter
MKTGDRDLKALFLRFLGIGCIAFGGPMAHLALFQRIFVERLQWLTMATYAEIVAVCQALPGPASSQVVMTLGYRRAGWPGMLLAWTGFTLPPVCLMLAMALGALHLPESLRGPLLHGVKVSVIAVVALALWSMGKRLLTDPSRMLMTVLFALFFLTFPTIWTFVFTLLLISLLAWREHGPDSTEPPASRRSSLLNPYLLALLLFWGLTRLIAFVPGEASALPAIFYQTGLLVFGGGHVILPVLERFLVEPGLLPAETFLLGYGFAQLVPGPLFSMAAFVGASMGQSVPTSLALGLIALAAINLPSFCLLGWILPRWQKGDVSPRWKAVLATIHPVVLGLLAATWVNPLLLRGLHHWSDAAIALITLALLARTPRLTLPILLLSASTAAFLNLH